MSQEFEDIVNAPINAMRRAGRRIKNKKIPENTPDKIVRIGDKSIRIPVKKIKKSARVGGLVASGMAVALLWMTKYLALDNHVTRKLEELFAKIKQSDKEGKEKLWRKFVKKNPNLVGHIVYYMVVAATVAGVDLSQDDSVTEKFSGNIKETLKEWLMDFEDYEEEKVEVVPGTYGAYKARMRAVTPLVIADLIAKEGVHMANGMHTPYLDSKNVWTIGFGNTVLKDGTHVTKNTPPITNEEAYELARHHLEDGETYFMLYCYDLAFDAVNISTISEAVAMNSLGYNAHCKLIEKEDKNCKERFAKLRDVYKKYGDATTDEQVKELFDKYPVISFAGVGEAWLTGADKAVVADRIGGFLGDASGIRWRRWLEACVLNGDISPQQMLDVPINGMYEFFERVGRERANWFTDGSEKTRHVNKQTLIKFQEWIKNPVDKRGNSIASWTRVRDVMPPEVVAQCLEQSDKLDTRVKKYKKTRREQRVEKDTYVLGYEEAYAAAIVEYNQGNFWVAAKKYEDMIKKYPDNALLRNDLAATYNRLERYDDAIAQVREIVKRIGDKSQYGAAQYNAGFAYEQLGNLEKAQANYRLAIANGNSRVKKDLERVTRALQTKTRAKKVAFNDAAGRVQKLDTKTVNYMDYVDGRQV